MDTDAPRLTKPIMTGWAVGELATATYVGITMMYLLFFLTEALGVPPAWAGVALIIPRLWDVITDPVMGAISDRTRSRWGRRRPYLALGGVLFGISFSLMFLVPHIESKWFTVIYFTVMYLIVSTAYTIYSVPFSSMAAEMSGNYKERTLLTGFKMIAARLGIVISVVVAPYLFGSRDNLRDGFQIMGLVLGSFILVTGLVAFFSTAHAPKVNRPVPTFNLREELRAVVTNRPFRILFGVFFFQNLAIGASATALIYYLTVVMGTSPKMAGYFFAVTAVSATIFTPPWVYIGRRFGKTGSYTASMILAAVVSIPVLFLPASMLWLLFGIMFVAGIADAGNQLLSNSMVPDTVEIDELQTGQRREGAIFGAWTFCQKLGMAVGAFIVSLGLGWSGYVAGEAGAHNQPQSVLVGIRILYALVPFVLWIAAVLVLRRYELSEHRFNEVKAAIGDAPRDEESAEEGTAPSAAVPAAGHKHV